MRIPSFHISVRLLALLTFAGFCALILILIWFNQHTLEDAAKQLGRQGDVRLIQVEKFLSIKAALHQLKDMAQQRTVNDSNNALQLRLQERSQILLEDWHRTVAELPDDDLAKHNELVILEKVLTRFARRGYWEIAELLVSEEELRRAENAIESLSERLIATTPTENKSISLAIENHQRQLHVIAFSVVVILSIGLWWVYRLLVTQLRKLSYVARQISSGQSNAKDLNDWNCTLTELDELRDMTHRMVTNLTASHHFLAANSKSLLLMTHKTSNIALQLKSGVIEEHSISKDIFGDLREIHIGNQQMQEALLNSMKVLATASASDCLDEHDIIEIREQMSLMSDISSGWKALADDLSRVLDGFDDMVRERMTLASELDTLTKVMHNSAKEMAFKAS